MLESQAKILNSYLEWKTDKLMFPPQFTPEEFLQEIVYKDSVDKINKIHELLKQDISDPMETLVGIQEIMEEIYE